MDYRDIIHTTVRWLGALGLWPTVRLLYITPLGGYLKGYRVRHPLALSRCLKPHRHTISIVMAGDHTPRITVPWWGQWLVNRQYRPTQDDPYLAHWLEILNQQGFTVVSIRTANTTSYRLPGRLLMMAVHLAMVGVIGGFALITMAIVSAHPTPTTIKTMRPSAEALVTLNTHNYKRFVEDINTQLDTNTSFSHTFIKRKP